jgi:AraC-like DNA-binding protein
MLEKILRMTHSDLSQILIDGHSSLLAKLLTQNALTARCLITKFIQRKGTFQASRLLISDISTECGFEDSNYFSVVFTRETGMTPSQWRHLNSQKD